MWRMDLRDLIKAAEQQGWRVERTQAGHWKFVPPDRTKPMVFVAGTPSDTRRFLRNLLSDLRRSGFRWPWPPGKGEEP